MIQIQQTIKKIIFENRQKCQKIQKNISHLNHYFLAFSNKFCTIKVDLSGSTV